MTKFVEFFDGLDHQNAAEEYLHRIHAHMILTIWEKLVDLVAYNHSHE